MTTNGNSLHLTGTGAGYIRVSDDEQDTLRQHEAIRAFERRHGVSIPEQNLFKDEGWARDTANRRPEFLRLMKLAEAGKVQWIVVSERDRFGTADADEFMFFRYQLRKWGCQLYDVAGTDWTRKDIATVITAVVDGEKSEQEQHSISKRALGAKAALARAGEWQGGLPRLGFDVVCYSKATGAELWRVIVEGLHKRLKVYPDGREERFDGKGNSPKFQEMTEVLRLAPSKDRAKIDAAVSVFKRFAEESISPSALAHYLNSLGYRTAQGGCFQGHHVKAMLQDPAYLGYYRWNRRHFGKFHRYKDGQTILELNYEEKQSDNSKADWVYSERLFEPLVDRATWVAVQQKLESPKRVSAPRSAALYLAGLVYCGNCGQKMYAGRGSSSKAGSQPLRFEFICSGYFRAVRYKQRQHNTCLRNGVFQHELEPYIQRYLEEAGKRLEFLTGGLNEGHLTDRLKEQETRAWGGFRDGIARLIDYLMDHHPEEYAAIVEESNRRAAEDEEATRNAEPATTSQLKRLGERVAQARRRAKNGNTPDRTIDSGGFVDACLACYRANFDPAALEAELAALRDEHERLVSGWIDLPTKRAKETAAGQLAALDTRIGELERQRLDVSETVERHYREMRGLQRAITEAQFAMQGPDGERAHRQRAQALRAAILRIECTFTPTGQSGSGHGRKNTRLTKITIFPVVGDAHCFLVDAESSVLRATRATSHM